MKRTIKTITLLALALALLLSNVAWAENADAVKEIFEALLAEGSSYSEVKKVYAEYYPDAVFEETLGDDGFTLSVSGSEYMDGSWTYTRDGDALVSTFASDDLNGSMTAVYVVRAVGAYFGMNADLISGYINGLSALDIENKNFVIARDDAANTTSVRINIAGPWDMKELDGMELTEQAMYLDSLGEDFTSNAASIGKLRMIANGTADDVTILLGEYAALDELALHSIVNVVKVLQPKGWEDFAANYTGLAPAEASGYTVSLDVDYATAKGIIEDAPESFSYMLVHFGG